MQKPKPNYYRRASFVLAAHQLNQLPPDEGLEVAFAGRSNAGKSSALNKICDQSGLARTSKTPGRTQQIVIFAMDDSRRLADLPGYGYAQVPLAVKRHWQATLQRYLEERHSLRGLVLLMDIRHPLTEYDRAMIAWCEVAAMEVHILLTKADKLKRGAAMGALQKVQHELATLLPRATLQLFSAQDGTGVEAVRERLDNWLEVPHSVG